MLKLLIVSIIILDFLFLYESKPTNFEINDALVDNLAINGYNQWVGYIKCGSGNCYGSQVI